MRWVLIPVIVFLSHQPGFALSKQERVMVVKRARLEVSRNVRYDPSYRKINYPGGDVPAKVGACTDVIIRAYRAIGYDFQLLIHRYRGENSDTNIDHRRCKNQIAYLIKAEKSLTKDPKKPDWQAGDIVFWDLNGKGLLHTGIISDLRTKDGKPNIIHNIGPIAREEPVLDNWKIIEHFRIQSLN